MPKFTSEERARVKTLVAMLSIKRVPDSDIIAQVKGQTGKKISRMALYDIRKAIKKDSYHWYKTMREGQYEYIHEFKERIDEILWLQKKHHDIIDSPTESTSNKQTSLAELHRLNITLANYFDVAPDIIGPQHTISTPSQTKATTAASERDNIIV